MELESAGQPATVVVGPSHLGDLLGDPSDAG
jgi:hypothetical protein